MILERYTVSRNDCYGGVAESCVYSSALILYYSIDLCTNVGVLPLVESLSAKALLMSAQSPLNKQSESYLKGRRQFVGVNDDLSMQHI